MEESVRQLTDVERTRAVSMAQQETVSLAQILKVSTSRKGYDIVLWGTEGGTQVFFCIVELISVSLTKMTSDKMADA